MSELFINYLFLQVILLTLSGFVEWVGLSHIMSDKGRLLHILCLFLGDPSFRCHASECLLQIVNRKGKIDDRKQLMILFTEDALRYIHATATVIAPVGSIDLQENHYLFKKKLVQVLSGTLFYYYYLY